MRSLAALCLCACLAATAARADDIVSLKYSRTELEAAWRTRIQSLLAKGKLPKIDMETSLGRDQAAEYLSAAFTAMDDLGVAMFAADGYQRPKDGSKGYRWSSYILDLVNRYPDRFVPTANGGTNPNWTKQKGDGRSFTAQMETAIRSGAYFHMGELEFRHYMSSSQCRNWRLDRDVTVPMDSANGRRIFALSAETGVPFSAHLEPEDAALDALEKMLGEFPKAKVIVAHLGQVRHPEAETRFTPAYVRKLLTTYPNLYYDLSTGGPSRHYKCAGPHNSDEIYSDTVLWEGSGNSQSDTVTADWRAVLTDFSDRFVFASDYGGGRDALPGFLAERVANFNLIIRDLPDAAKRNIAYRNAWKLLTGRPWE